MSANHTIDGWKLDTDGKTLLNAVPQINICSPSVPLLVSRGGHVPDAPCHPLLIFALFLMPALQILQVASPAHSLSPVPLLWAMLGHVV